MRRRAPALLLAAVLFGTVLCGCDTSPADTPTDPAATSAPSDPLLTLATPVAPEDAIDPTSPEAGSALLYAENLEAQGEAAPDRLTGFGLMVEDNPTLPYSFSAYIAADGTVSGVLPAGVDLSAVIPVFFYAGQEVRWNGRPLLSGQSVVDLSQPTSFTLIDGDGAEHTVAVRIQTLYTGLPSVALTTDTLLSITSKTQTVPCTFYVGGGDAACCPYAVEEPVLVTAQARGRGNSSWTQDKKGYSVNLDKASALLDMPSARKWALVANYEDKTLLRNYVADYVTAQSTLDSTVSVRPVDLWYNGQYWGTYNLCERVNIHPARVNITEQKDLTGLEPSQVAYLFEFDGHVNEVSRQQKNGWQTVGGAMIYDPATDETFVKIGLGDKWITVKQPDHEELTGEMAQYARRVINDACAALNRGNWEEIDALLDVRSFVQWYMIEEFMNNTDSSMHSSVYMYLDVGGKLTMCTPWDFDRSSGNCDYWNVGGAPDALYTSTAGWFSYLFQCEEARALLKSEWEIFSAKLASIGDIVEAEARMLSVSQQYNFKRWDILKQKVGANPSTVVRARTYEAQVTLLRDYLTERRGKMDDFIHGLS